MPSFGKTIRSGMTLIEIMISVSIISIISAIVFVGFANEQERNGVKRGTEQLQIDVQAMQSRAQSNSLLPDGTTAVAGYGVELLTTAGSYQLFGDAPGATNHGLDVGELLETQSLGRDVVIQRFTLTPNPPQPATSLTIVYDLPDGRLHLTSNPGAAVIDDATIILRQTKADLCYSLTVRAASGTVSRRDIATCP